MSKFPAAHMTVPQPRPVTKWTRKGESVDRKMASEASLPITVVTCTESTRISIRSTLTHEMFHSTSHTHTPKTKNEPKTGVVCEACSKDACCVVCIVVSVLCGLYCCESCLPVCLCACLCLSVCCVCVCMCACVLRVCIDACLCVGLLVLSLSVLGPVWPWILCIRSVCPCVSLPSVCACLCM